MGPNGWLDAPMEPSLGMDGTFSTLSRSSRCTDRHPMTSCALADVGPMLSQFTLVVWGFHGKGCHPFITISLVSIVMRRQLL